MMVAQRAILDDHTVSNHSTALCMHSAVFGARPATCPARLGPPTHQLAVFASSFLTTIIKTLASSPLDTLHLK